MRPPAEPNSLRYVLVPDRPLRFLADDEARADEWHSLEIHSDGCHFRWMGLSSQASRLLPIHLDRRVHLRIKVLYEVQPNLLLRSTLSVNGHRIDPTQVVTCPGGLEWQGHVDPEDWPESDTDGMTVTIEVPQTYCPSELGMSADLRHLALGIGWMQVDPA
ncbi:hypothetical protein [Hydrogenophaga sp. MI9]|uniref:hypothetical protein n=1 Tax=Hydrogenophaga sp. MI9 TaxID=3453719 RepID=UPI003EE9D58A